MPDAVSQALEPDRDGMLAMGEEILRRAVAFVDGLADRPANGVADPDAASLLAPPPETPVAGLTGLLDRIEGAAGHAFETAGPGFMAYVPGGGLFASAAIDLYTRAVNRYSGVAAAAPALAAMEHSVVRWLGDVCGLPEERGGLLTSGGSMANLSAIVAARHAGLGEDLRDGTLYVGEQAHQSVLKAAVIAGLPRAAVRVVPGTGDLRMDVGAAQRMIAEDRAAGRRPFLLVASAGTTNTGTVDPLPGLADVAAREDLWWHVDGAYGGLFMLTDRGRARMAGIERADSITLDPHKTMFLPYGTGALVVRDPARLAAAHESGGTYLQDLPVAGEVPDYGHLGLELTRDQRGLRAWLPLHLYGVGAFRAALDEKLDLALEVHRALSKEPALDVPREPELSTVAFRMRAGDDATRELLRRVNATGRVFLSSTVLDDRFTIRVCVVSHRTHADRIAEAIEIIRTAVVTID